MKAILLLLVASACTAAHFYVSPDGKPGVNGSSEAPWDLATALAHPASVKPGDTIWLRGGIYYGTYVSRLAGTPEAPILVRQYPAERAVIDQNESRNGSVLRIHGGWAWFRDFEITNSNPVRVLSVPGSNPPERRANSIDVYGSGVKLINLVIHNTGQGPGLWSQAENTEVYGCIIFNNGWQGPDRTHGHGLYTQNRKGRKVFRDNLLFNQFSNGINVYGSSTSSLQGYVFEGNVSFNHVRNLIGGSADARAITLRDNHFFNNVVQFGYDSRRNSGLVLERNWFTRGIGLQWWTDVSIVENTIFTLAADNQSRAVAITYNRPEDRTTYQIDGNRYMQRAPGAYEFWSPGSLYRFAEWQQLGFDKNGSMPWTVSPQGTHVFVRPNVYEPGRFHAIVYNWDRKPYVTIPAADFRNSTAPHLQFTNVQNFRETITLGAAAEGFTLPMDRWTVSADAGGDRNPTTFPHFGVFLVTRAVPLTVQVRPAHVTPTSVTLQWSTTSPATAIVRYGTSGESLVEAEAIRNASPNHTWGIRKLHPDTRYYFRVESTDAAGRVASSPIVAVRTAAVPPPSTAR